MTQSHPRCGAGSLAMAAVLVLCMPAATRSSDLASAAVAAAGQPTRPVAIRVQWGGGKPQAWTGTVAVTASDRVAAPSWRTLSTEPDAAAMVHEGAAGLVVHQHRPVANDGVEFSVADWRTARVRIGLAAAGSGHPGTTLDVAVADVLAGAVQQPLDGDGNRLVVRQAAGDALRVVVVGPPGEPATLRRPGERVRMRVDPLLPVQADPSGRFELRVRLTAGSREDTHDAKVVPIVPRAAGGDAGDGRRLTPFEAVDFEIMLPAWEGPCDVELQAVEVGSLRWSRPLAARTVQLVAVADRPPTASAADWKVVHEVDPGSPRLHERLRRLSGSGLAQVGLPGVTLPPLPLPTLTRPNVPLPNVPLPKLPNVPLPPMAAMVPRFSGLLAAGHSTVEPHALGPMLVLPPARAAGEPTWEGIVVAGAQPGIPHAVEIDYPSDQDAVVGVTVLELDAVGTTVEPRHAGGFEVRRDPAAAAARLQRHRFVFWPTTRNPVILLANPATRQAATIGKVRVLAGPARLCGTRPDAAAGDAGARRIYALLPQPGWKPWGGAERVDEATGRGFADWGTHLAGARHAAEWLAAQGAAGAVVAVYAEGAAAWPSPISRQAPRWGSGAAADTGLDPEPKDVLALMCRVCAAEGLRLIPALVFDAPLPELEAEVAAGGAAAVGITCLGRDGRPRGGPHGPRYNLLDPRVQDAVERRVRELAGRLRGVAAVDGVALLLPHDGWLHLPGAAWGLDDATFARFMASVGAREPAADGDRFARRAEMVEGPIRDLWLEWRADAIAAFHARLATVLAEVDPRLVLHVVPTTLFADGDLAGRFRPRLAGAAAGDAMREAGLDPQRSTAHPQVVFASPHVHVAAAGLMDRGRVAAANLDPVLADAARSARRRSIAIVEQPMLIDVRPAAAQGPFGSAAPAGRFAIHAPAAGAEAGRPLAEALAAADAEAVFDMRIGLGGAGDEDASERAFAALPGQPLPAGNESAPPLVIRTRPAAGATWVSLVNAAGAPGRIRVGLEGRPAAVSDAVDRSPVDLTTDGVATVPVGAWSIRTLLVDGTVTLRSARIEYDDAVRTAVTTRVQDLRRRRLALETPAALEVLDNPGFEVGPDGGGFGGRPPKRTGPVTGWELVEQRRGTLEAVPGMPGTGDGQAGRGLAFASANGLASLHSNPFPPPVTGRASVAVWLRLDEGDPQPPLRIAIEGVHEDREYYRFATVGGLAGGRPLTTEWAQFVLPVDDLPPAGLESLRVRFDLLGPGRVLIDDVRVYDLAFDESQRVQLSRLITGLEQALARGDIGGCLVGLDGHWPRFLAEFVTAAAVARVAALPAPTSSPAARPAEVPPRPATMLDRLRSWWP